MLEAPGPVVHGIEPIRVAGDRGQAKPELDPIFETIPIRIAQSRIGACPEMGGPDASHSIPGEPEVVPVGRDDDVMTEVRTIAAGRDRSIVMPPGFDQRLALLLRASASSTRLICRATIWARRTGTAFPICRRASPQAPVTTKSGGKVWTSLAS